MGDEAFKCRADMPCRRRLSPSPPGSRGCRPGKRVDGQAAVALELPGGGLGHQADDAIDLGEVQGPADQQVHGWASHRHITAEPPGAAPDTSAYPPQPEQIRGGYEDAEAAPGAQNAPIGAHQAPNLFPHETAKISAATTAEEGHYETRWRAMRMPPVGEGAVPGGQPDGRRRQRAGRAPRFANEPKRRASTLSTAHG
jgi:hypothetical protein